MDFNLIRLLEYGISGMQPVIKLFLEQSIYRIDLTYMPKSRSRVDQSWVCVSSAFMNEIGKFCTCSAKIHMRDY